MAETPPENGWPQGGNEARLLFICPDCETVAFSPEHERPCSFPPREQMHVISVVPASSLSQVEEERDRLRERVALKMDDRDAAMLRAEAEQAERKNAEALQYLNEGKEEEAVAALTGAADYSAPSGMERLEEELADEKCRADNADSIRLQFQQEQEEAVHRAEQVEAKLEEVRAYADRLHKAWGGESDAAHRLYALLDSNPPQPQQEDCEGQWPAGISDGLSLPCVDCGRVPKFDYRVDDDFWHRWVPDKPDRLGVVCLPCLDRRSGGVGLADALRFIQWTGTGHTVELVPERVHCYKPPASSLRPASSQEGTALFLHRLRDEAQWLRLNGHTERLAVVESWIAVPPHPSNSQEVTD